MSVRILLSLVFFNFPLRLIFRSKERTNFRWMKGTQYTFESKFPLVVRIGLEAIARGGWIGPSPSNSVWYGMTIWHGTWWGFAMRGEGARGCCLPCWEALGLTAGLAVLCWLGLNQTRRIYTEEKAKVVAASCGTEFLQFLARLAILYQDELKNKLICTQFFK